MAFSVAGGGAPRPDHCLAAHRAAGDSGCAAVAQEGEPPERGPGEPSTLAGRAATAAASKRSTAEHGTAIAIRQVQELQNIVEQDHRGIKRSPRPMGGCTAVATAQATRVGIALLPRVTTRQLVIAEGNAGRTVAALFDSRAA